MARSRRNQLIAKIHIAKTQLCLDDDTYRCILAFETGKRSSAKMAIWELEKVFKAMVDKHGFKPRPNKAGKRHLSADGQSKKIRSLWLQLHECDKVKDPSEAALAKWIKSQTKRDSAGGIEALQWLSSRQKQQLIEKLKRWLER